MPLTFGSIEDFEATRERAIESPWIVVTQELIDDFARVTGDRQWIHVDPVRAQRESPYGTTVAHGFLTLSLLSRMFHESCTVRVSAGINYGLEHVRFISPIRSGTRIRGTFALEDVRRIEGGADVRWQVQVNAEGDEKPALVALWLLRLYI
jgi:acyl dehydratase